MLNVVAEEFLVMNPLLNSNMDLYIWISDSLEEHEMAQKLFDYLMKRNIYIKGFATNKKLLLPLKMYNKKIYDIDKLDEKHSVILHDSYIYVSYFECLDRNIIDQAQRARVINTNINMEKDNFVIWGSGKTGEHVCKILKSMGAQIKCFIDSNRTLDGTVKCGISIHTSDYLNQFDGNITIIEAMEKWQELDKSIQGKYEKRFHFSLYRGSVNDQVTCMENGIEKGIFCLAGFWMLEYIGSRRVYIYGIGDVEKEFAKYLKLLDFDFAGFLIDSVDEQGDKVVNEANCPVKYVEEIIYEENSYIWVHDKKRLHKLRDLGLNYYTDYIHPDYMTDITMGRKVLLDVNLAHNYFSESKYPGICVYGKEKEDDYKIVVLGGSTTDGALYPFKSWPELLSEELEGVTIYNGGVCGYTSGQELIKLVRDMLLLKPNMIIVFDGFNDLCMLQPYPFSSAYLEKVFDFAKAHLEGDEEDHYIDGNPSPVCKGLVPQMSNFDLWMSNVESMYAIALERNIKFFCFCQPISVNKKGKTLWEKNLLISLPGNQVENYATNAFGKKLANLAEIPDYIYDLSHIFDGEEDVYMDVIHAWEKGNRIIAKEIKKIILPQLYK